MMEKVFAWCRAQEVFAQTGIQFMQLNSLYQFYAMKLAGSPALAAAQTLLFMPDLFNYWLTGVAQVELTIASTSQFYNPRTEDMGDRSARPPWPADADSAGDCGARHAPRSAAAFRRGGRRPRHAFRFTRRDATTPRRPWRPCRPRGDNWCYISSGTWSLMGVELDEPVINERALAENLTNEIGAGGKVRFLKNIAGLWLLQECRRAWALEGREYTYDQLVRMAGEARPFSAAPRPGRISGAWRHAAPRSRPIAAATGQTAAGDARRVSRAPFSRAWRFATGRCWRAWKR